MRNRFHKNRDDRSSYLLFNMSIIGTVYEDVTTDVLGYIGPWQWTVTLISTAFMTSNMFTHYQDMPLLQPTKYTICIRPERYATLNYSLCFIKNGTVNYNCDVWNIKFMGFLWTKRSWMIFCDDKLHLLSMAVTSRVGSAFGCIIFGLVADSFGRKRAMCVSVFMEMPIKLVVTFIDSKGWYKLLIFVNSIFGGANLFMGIILTMEIASNVWRSRLISITILPKAISTVCLVPLANCLPNIETLNFISFLYGAVLIALLRWTTESPHWLLYNRKITTAEKIILEAAERNRIELTSQFKIRPVDYRAYNCLDEPITCLGICSTHNVRVLTLITLIIWGLYEFIWTTVHLLIYSSHSSKNNLLYIFCTEVIFVCLTVYLLNKFTMKTILLLNVTTAGVFTSALVVLKEYDFFGLATSIIAISCGILSRYLLTDVTSRILAINVRATLFGSCQAVGQVGAVISYIIFFLDVTDVLVFSIVIVFITITVLILCFMLPDVDGRELPDVIEDVDYFLELTKPLRWASQKTNSTSKEEIEMKVHSFSTCRNTSRERFSDERPPAARLLGCDRFWRLITSPFRRRNTK